MAMICALDRRLLVAARQSRPVVGCRRLADHSHRRQWQHNCLRLVEIVSLTGDIVQFVATIAEASGYHKCCRPATQCPSCAPRWRSRLVAVRSESIRTQGR